MTQPDLVVVSKHTVTPSGVREAAVHVKDGKIVAVTPAVEAPKGARTVDVGDLVLMPGLVDTHVHVNEPGRTEWEGFRTATMAAAAGGITTIVDMPLNSIPPTTTLAALKEKAAAAEGKCYVDYAFWGGVVPGNTSELAPMYEAGVRGFKCFLCPSGVPEFEHVTEKDLREAMPVIARLGAVLLVHAELPELLKDPAKGADPRKYATFLATRPREAENKAIELMIRLSRETRCRVHIVHLSSAEALRMLRDAKAEGIPITVETCPHYLFFNAERVPDGRTEFKCCPPIRELNNRESLWQGLLDGTIDMVVSDHSPSPPEMKRLDTGDFLAAWGGIASLQISLPVFSFAHAERTRQVDYLGMTPFVTRSPAVLAQLQARKGEISVGRDADFGAWNLFSHVEAKPAKLLHRHALNPYQNGALFDEIEVTWLRGEKVYDRMGICGEPRGRWVVA